MRLSGGISGKAFAFLEGKKKTQLVLSPPLLLALNKNSTVEMLLLDRCYLTFKQKPYKTMPSSYTTLYHSPCYHQEISNTLLMSHHSLNTIGPSS